MRRPSHFENRQQIALPFDPTQSADSWCALFEAYSRLEVSRRVSFQQFMSRRACAIGVRNLADAIARRERSRSATPTAAAEEGGRLEPELVFEPEQTASLSKDGDR